MNPSTPPPGSRLARAVVPVVIVTLIVALVVTACGESGAGSGASASPGNPDAVKVVTTTTIFADMVREIGGDRVSVESLVPKGGEVHTFDPTPSDVRRVTEAQLVLLNGLGLDEWLADLVADAGTSAPVVRIAEDLDGVTLLEGEAHEGEEAEEVNPHVWMNVAYASLYAQRIADELARVDPAGAQAYEDGLAAYQAELAELDEYARTQLGSVPEANRTVVSFHDAFPYFAAAYGLTIDGTVVDAPGQDPSAGEVADLVNAIRANNVRAIFAEAQFSEDLVRTIADETGATVVGDLYTDSVGDAPQDSFVSMMRWNIDQVVAALKG
ncbi:MAG TPA: metal ABC transporter substrate-binding protein [Candidatus Limnocylindrales bacterium]|nr:metal ABC transporter substrate-binding protein [Candidatus Limnocylindrales bacterium]